MPHQVEVHKSSQNPAGGLWWRPVFDAQRELNANLRRLAPPFMPSSLWNGEEILFETLQQNAHRLFSEIYNTRQLLAPWRVEHAPEPYIDIIEYDELYRIRADVPGLREEELEISVADNALTICGESKACGGEENEHYIRRECCNGAFSRTIALPDDADLDHVSAELERSVLTIAIPKKRPKTLKRKPRTSRKAA